MKAEIASMTEPNAKGSQKVTFKYLDGSTVTAYANQAYVTANLKVGVSAELVTESKDGNDGSSYLTCKQWGDAKPKGGGGKTYQPKTPEEIHAASIAGVIKSCIEHEKNVASAREWLKLYDEFARGSK